ncbi:aldo/keto reductase [Nocardioides sp. SYSU D00038]|uniref:aldo/keto reductase n=1 Tax=Nocardioides sp. SYSU D00038 TaxID=2812554 RepID=UPI0019686F12|nr:aldo/keto reductase [Nocardioides sp. SYSU D00038]
MTEPATAPRLGLGGAGLGNHRVALDDDAAAAILDEAWHEGVRLLDTAPHYGLGLSERRIGRFLAGRARDDVRISTKVGRRLEAQQAAGAADDEGFLVPADARRVWDFTPDGIRATLEESLCRLGTDRIDVAYLHDPERWDLRAALDSGLPALARLREEGLVGAVGVGSMDLLALVEAAGREEVDELMVAGRWTLLDQRAAEELLPRCAEHSVAVVAAAVFHGGLLTGPPVPGATYDYAAAPERVLARARHLHDACAAYGVPVAAAALQWPLRHSSVRSVVVGADRPGQVAANRALLEVEVPDELWHALTERKPVGS